MHGDPDRGVRAGQELHAHRRHPVGREAEPGRARPDQERRDRARRRLAGRGGPRRRRRSPGTARGGCTPGAGCGSSALQRALRGRDAADRLQRRGQQVQRRHEVRTRPPSATGPRYRVAAGRICALRQRAQPRQGHAVRRSLGASQHPVLRPQPAAAPGPGRWSPAADRTRTAARRAPNRRTTPARHGQHEGATAADGSEARPQRLHRLTSMLAIIPASSWARMWQWNTVIAGVAGELHAHDHVAVRRQDDLVLVAVERRRARRWRRSPASDRCACGTGGSRRCG